MNTVMSTPAEHGLDLLEASFCTHCLGIVMYNKGK
jgi:hypothetical protein